MHGRPRQLKTPTRRTTRATLAHASGAVTWIDSSGAVIATKGASGGVSVRVVRRDPGPVGAPIPFLARVVDEIGDRDRVVIMGPDAARVELEREYVAIFRRPDRIVDVESSGPTAESELVRRLEVLTGG